MKLPTTVCSRWFWIFFLCICACMSSSAAESPSETPSVGKMTSVSSAVSVFRDSGDRLSARIGTPIFPGDRIETESDARAEFLLDDAGTFQIGASTELAIDDLSRGDGRSGVIGLFAGYLVPARKLIKLFFQTVTPDLPKENGTV